VGVPGGDEEGRRERGGECGLDGARSPNLGPRLLGEVVLWEEEAALKGGAAGARGRRR
jgi:hypothetical protein